MKCWGTLYSHYAPPYSSPPISGGGRYRLSFPYRNPQETIGYSFLFFKLQLISPSITWILHLDKLSCCTEQYSPAWPIELIVTLSILFPSVIQRFGYSDEGHVCSESDCLLWCAARRKRHTWCVMREWGTADVSPRKGAMCNDTNCMTDVVRST